MINNFDKTRVAELISKAKAKGLVKTYSKFCETKEGIETAISKDEMIYYTSRNKGATK